jgi:hypothetical protein
MNITNVLSQSLQRRSKVLVNALHLVSSARSLLQDFRENGWSNLVGKLINFCEKNIIFFPDMSAAYNLRGARTRRQPDHFTTEHYYRVQIFLVAVDTQIQEINCKFNDGAIELLTLTNALISKDGYVGFNVDDIVRLVEKYYPENFTNQERIMLNNQLRHFIVDVPQHEKF